MTEFEQIPLAKLEPHPANIRKSLHDIDELADSIKSKGIVQALTVAPHPTARTKYLVLGGHRRLAAAKQAKVKLAPCMIRTDLSTPELQTEFMLVENTQRNDLTAMEEAHAFQTLLDLPGYDAKKIAAGTGRNLRAIKERVKLAKLGDLAAEKLNAGQITLEQAMVFAEFSEDESATSELLQAVGTYNWEWAVKRVRSRRDTAQRITTETARFQQMGVEIVEKPEQFPWGGPLEKAEQLETAEEHIAAGHTVIIDPYFDGTPIWVKPRTTPSPIEPTPEELAAEAERERVAAGLDIAAHVRSEHLANFRNNADACIDLAEKLLRRRLISAIEGDPVHLEFLGLPGEATAENIAATIKNYGLPQLIVLDHQLDHSLEERNLRAPSNWGPTNWGYDGTAEWRQSLVVDYGYTFSDIEREAMDNLRKHEDDDDA